MNLKQMFDRICNKFMTDTVRAGTRAQYVMGVRMRTKNDIRTEFIANLRAVRDMAHLRGDDNVLAMCNGEITIQEAQVEPEKEGFNLDSEA
jgi:hypothetical protein